MAGTKRKESVRGTEKGKKKKERKKEKEKNRMERGSKMMSCALPATRQATLSGRIGYG